MRECHQRGTSQARETQRVSNTRFALVGARRTLARWGACGRLRRLRSPVTAAEWSIRTPASGRVEGIPPTRARQGRFSTAGAPWLQAPQLPERGSKSPNRGVCLNLGMPHTNSRIRGEDLASRDVESGPCGGPCQGSPGWRVEHGGLRGSRRGPRGGGGGVAGPAAEARTWVPRGPPCRECVSAPARTLEFGFGPNLHVDTMSYHIAQLFV